MALKKCKECGGQVSSKAKQCPQCGAVQKRQVGCLGVLFLCGLAVVFMSSILPESSQTYQPPETVQEDQSDSVKKQKPWTYSNEEYSMGKGRVYHAVNNSVNTVNFDPPYSGAQRASLILRTHPKHGKDLIFRIKEGQILTSASDGALVMVRFDNGEPINFRVMPSSDYDSRVVFFKDYYGFVKRMLKSKRVRVSVNIYHEGQPMFEFDVSDFEQKEYLPAK